MILHTQQVAYEETGSFMGLVLSQIRAGQYMDLSMNKKIPFKVLWDEYGVLKYIW